MKLIVAIAACLSTAIILYGAASFIAWDLDPMRWGAEGRVVFVIFFGLSYPFVVGAALAWLRDLRE